MGRGLRWSQGSDHAECLSDAQLVNLKVLETLTQPSAPDREIGADKPGRTHAADGLSGSAVEETSWQDQAEAEFLKQVAGKLDDLVQEKKARRIVLVAPPKALGTLRLGTPRRYAGGDHR